MCQKENKSILENRMKSDLDKRSQNNALRELKRKSDLSDFSSNDYLGFAKKSFSNEQEIGSGGSRLLSGNTSNHENLEQRIAEIHKSEGALLFNSGYTANVGLLSTIAQKGDTVIYDELIHASIRDGLQMSNARNFSFKHNDVNDLAQRIQRTEGLVYVLVESVYSMDGDHSPLIEISKLCREKEALLIVDEAHSVGLYGEDGSGLVNELNLENEVYARVITYGKAFGFHGAAIVGSKLLRTYLINFCRSFIYTTAISNSDVQKLDQLYNEIVIADNQRRELFNKVKLMQYLLMLDKSNTSPIVSYLIPGNLEVKACSRYLQEKGYDVRPIMSPTVSKGEERLRICVHVYNTDEEIRTLCQLLLDYKS